ncbi:MAG: hypothetical protein ABIS21_02480 [Acidimicrobiales bacterium]
MAEPAGATEPAGVTEPAGIEPEAPGAAALTEKPVLEWTTEDWARWIQEPPAVSRPEPDHDFVVPEQSDPIAGASSMEVGGGEATATTGTLPVDTAPPDEGGSALDDDPTGVWSLALEGDEEQGDGQWWSSVAGLFDGSPPEALPLPAPAFDPPAASPSAPPVALPASLDPPRPATAAVTPSPRSSAWRVHGLEPESHDMAVRVRAGLSLLGVSLLVGAVAAGLITVTIFMVAVVLRRALG